MEKFRNANEPIRAKPAAWDVTNKYLNYREDGSKLRELRKVKQPPEKAKVKIVNGVVFTQNLKGNFVSAGGSDLTRYLEINAKIGNSKITIING